MITVDVPTAEIERLTRKLASYGEAQQQNALDELHEAGLNVESEAKKLVNVDTGRLRASIHMESSKVNPTFQYNDNEGRSFDGSLDVTPKGLEVYVGTNVDYAIVQEQISPYLVPAWEQERVKLIARLKTELQKV